MSKQEESDAIAKLARMAERFGHEHAHLPVLTAEMMRDWMKQEIKAGRQQEGFRKFRKAWELKGFMSIAESAKRNDQ